ncbi:LysR family transcriptional regulator [Billgrantia ethanolica]|uniref:LysR family transcriptional regulator n=1 Tax=Billgrantia ethanolica TaxID=2733486 RepID=A0ABS9A360_9GAMM|nr:LysR family transcriptional regulator [Halomonas ethanolica]MCE8003266.1 LysR family transcriptional regulator [Halomonas ethanolica]
MRLDFLITVKTIVEKGSFALAAKAMNITPSAVSMQVKTVEQYFEKAMFNRAGQSVTPTPFAHELSARVGPLLEEIERLRGGHQASVTGRLQLGTISIMQPVVLPPLFNRLKELAPQLEVSCTPGRSQDLIEAVKLGELDAAIVAEPATASRRQLDWQLLQEVPFRLITPKQMPPGSDEDGLGAFPWIAYDRSTSLGKISRCLSLSIFGARPPALELQSLEGVISMVASGYGAAVVILPDPRLKHYDIDITSLGDDAPTLRFSLVSRKIEHNDRPIKIIRNILKRHYDSD